LYAMASPPRPPRNVGHARGGASRLPAWMLTNSRGWARGRGTLDAHRRNRWDIDAAPHRATLLRVLQVHTPATALRLAVRRHRPGARARVSQLARIADHGRVALPLHRR
jgi:hypothetical protein